MKIEQIYTGCLAEAAYYIESNGEAAIIDPLRETRPYIERAENDHAKIRYVFETHFHADFVSGHLDLARKTGALIVFGPTASPDYKAHIADDNELFKLGNVYIKVLHTPGHTLESTTYLLIDEDGKEKAIFTGDTLLIGDVGRPDLVQKVKADITPEYLAGKLFDSLRIKIMTLSDEVIVYPGHGAGSACGKNMSKETTDTLGHQKLVNYALRADMTRDEFIKEVIEGLVEPPQYFPQNVLINLHGGIQSIDEVIRRGSRDLSVKEFQTIWETLDALVLDTRKKEDFIKGHIPGSIFIGLDDNFAPWAGTLIADLQQPILLITESGREQEAVMRLARVGFDKTMGVLNGGIEEWQRVGEVVDTIDCISGETFSEIYSHNVPLLDVRRKSEFDSEHIVGALNIPLDFINQKMNLIDKNKKYFVYCAGGYRSVIFISIMKARGFHKMVNIIGGFNELSKTDLRRSEKQERRTML